MVQTLSSNLGIPPVGAFGILHQKKRQDMRPQCQCLIALLPLQSRLVRGEVFNIMRDYAALGVAIPWHPLVNQSLKALFNLNDSSSLVLTSLVYDPGDHQRWGHIHQPDRPHQPD